MTLQEDLDAMNALGDQIYAKQEELKDFDISEEKRERIRRDIGQMREVLLRLRRDCADMILKKK